MAKELRNYYQRKTSSDFFFQYKQIRRTLEIIETNIMFLKFFQIIRRKSQEWSQNETFYKDFGGKTESFPPIFESIKRKRHGELFLFEKNFEHFHLSNLLLFGNFPICSDPKTETSWEISKRAFISHSFSDTKIHKNIFGLEKQLLI